MRVNTIFSDYLPILGQLFNEYERKKVISQA